MSSAARCLRSIAALLLAACAFAALPVQAAERRVALVIGNGNYKNAPLPNPRNDATDMAQALQRAGFRVILRRDVDSRTMRQAVREFGNELRRAEVGLFYYAGHGMQLQGNNYLIPVGADINSEADAEDLSLDVNYVLRTMEDSRADVRIVILDACRNNPYQRAFRSTPRGLATMTAATGSLVAFATAPGSVAADGEGRNGVYTKHLLESMVHPDTDILKVFQRTRAGVVRETAGRQTPWESTSLLGDFRFAPLVAAAPAPAPVPALPAAAVAPLPSAAATLAPQAATPRPLAPPPQVAAPKPAAAPPQVAPAQAALTRPAPATGTAATTAVVAAPVTRPAASKPPSTTITTATRVTPSSPAPQVATSDTARPAVATPPPVQAAPKAPGRPARCSELLSKGNQQPLSLEEAEFLRRDCR